MSKYNNYFELIKSKTLNGNLDLRHIRLTKSQLGELINYILGNERIKILIENIGIENLEIVESPEESSVEQYLF